MLCIMFYTRRFFQCWETLVIIVFPWNLGQNVSFSVNIFKMSFHFQHDRDDCYQSRQTSKEDLLWFSLDSVH